MRRGTLRAASGPQARVAVAAILALTAFALQTPARGLGAPGNEAPSQVNWPKFHLDLANTGYNPWERTIGVDNVSSLTEAWSVPTGSVRGTPALWRGVIYVAGDVPPLNLLVRAIDAETGSVLWTQRIRSFGPETGVMYSRGALYVGTSDYLVYSLDARTGAVRWKVFLGGIPGNAVAAGGLLYVVINSGRMFALDQATGATVWKSEFLGSMSGAPALAGGLLYVGSYDHSVYALDAATGEKVWSYKTGDTVQYTSPAVSGGVVYAASQDTYLYALDAATGGLRWKRSLGNPPFGSPPSPAVAEGVVYASGNGLLQAFDAGDGTPLWSTQVADFTGSPVVANGVLYIPGSLDGTLNALDAATGTLLWTFTAGHLVSDPIVANGMVYAGSFDRHLYAFGLPG